MGSDEITGFKFIGLGEGERSCCGLHGFSLAPFIFLSNVV